MSRSTSRPRIALCLEQTLGHRAHARNIAAVAETYGGADIDILKVEYRDRGRFGPPWALRGSLAAARALRRGDRYDAALFHTQTVALFARWGSHAAPYVVSVDATPKQMDQLGHWYQHRRGNAVAEWAKRSWYRSALAGARAVVAWSDWAAGSLAEDYGVPDERLHIIHPGAPQTFFDLPVERPVQERPRILFVGGDFERKGGPALIQAWSGLRDRADLDIVTTADLDLLTAGGVGAMDGLRVLRGLEPGSRELVEAYRRADIFCLPTLGDCTSVAIGEAMAAGLPVVTTRVGSNEETAPGGSVSLLVAAGDPVGLSRALETLVSDRSLRIRMGHEGRNRANRLMNSRVNAVKLLDLVCEVVPRSEGREVTWAS